MTPLHHPTDEILARYAAATLDEGASLVVGVHLTFCAACRANMEMFEVTGGALLEALEPTMMSANSFARVLQRLDKPVKKYAQKFTARELAPGFAMPDVLKDHEVGPWRTLAPGVKMSRVTTYDPNAMNVFFLRASPGTSLLEHSHEGDEYICILKGAFVDQGGRHEPGDMAIADASVQHTPKVERDGECICLVALDGKMKPASLLGRLLQPVFGI